MPLKKVIVLGSGTSTGVPVIGCVCQICKSDNPKNKRLRASILLETDCGKKILIDTGPDHRQQMLREDIKKLDAIFYTHLHADHCAGFDDTRAFGFRGGEPISCYIGEDHKDDLLGRYAYAFSPTGYTGAKPKLDVKPLKEDQVFDLFGLEVEMVKAPHGDQRTSIFRFDDFVYATDFKYLPEPVVSRWRGKVTTMIASGIHFKTHDTHSVIPETVELIEKLGVKRGYVTHISHWVDAKKDSSRLPKNIEFCFDRQQILIANL